jgi:hypothetical protein
MGEVLYFAAGYSCRCRSDKGATLMRAPDQHLPPWKPRCESERKAFIDWTIEQLELLDAEDELNAAELMERWDGTMDPEVAFRGALYRAKASARSGNPKALAELLAAAVGDPEIADFDIIPHRQRWQHQPKPVDRTRAWAQYAEDELARHVIADVERSAKRSGPNATTANRTGRSTEILPAQPKPLLAYAGRSAKSPFGASSRINHV